MSAELTDEQAEQIGQLLQAGRKLEAVKLYREWTGSSLLDAKQRVERLPIDRQGPSAPPQPDLGDDPMDQILDAIRHGHKLQAVKLYRQRSGVSLKEAKEFVESLTKELQIVEPTAVVSSGGCGAVLLMIVAITIGLGVLQGSLR